MAVPLIAAGALMAAKMGSDYMAGHAAKDAAQAAADAKHLAMLEAKKLVEAVGIPEVEALKIVLAKPEYENLDFSPELLGQSAQEDIAPDALTESTRKKALLNLIQRSEQGLSPLDLDMARQIQDQGAAKTIAAGKAMQNSLAQQGINPSSGLSQMQALLSSQSAANNAAQDSRSLLRDAYANRISAQEAAGRMAESQGSTDYSRKLNKANRKDTISEINQKYSNQAKDASRSFNIETARQEADRKNKEQLYNKDILVDDYGRQLARAETMGNFALGQGNNAANIAVQRGQGKADMYRGIGKAAGSLAGIAGGMYNPNADALTAGLGGAKPKPASQIYDYNSDDDGEWS